MPEQAPGDQRGDQRAEQPTFEVGEMSEDRLGRLTEEPAGGTDEQGPRDSGQRVQHSKAQRLHRRRTDQDGAGDARAVDEAHRDGGKRGMAFDESANFYRAGGEAGPALEERGA